MALFPKRGLNSRDMGVDDWMLEQGLLVGRVLEAEVEGKGVEADVVTTIRMVMTIRMVPDHLVPSE